MNWLALEIDLPKDGEVEIASAFLQNLGFCYFEEQSSTHRLLGRCGNYPTPIVRSVLKDSREEPVNPKTATGTKNGSGIIPPEIGDFVGSVHPSTSRQNDLPLN